MRPISVSPTSVDRRIAAKVARSAAPTREHLAEGLTWAADEHILIAAAARYWLASRRGSSDARVAGNHLLVASIVTSVLPHLLKHLFNQRRPDRLTGIGHLHGIPISGRADDAFPSGHAMHMGALAGAATAWPAAWRNLALTVTLGISTTRIVVLAHWASDVAAGFAGRFAIERMLRRFTGYSRQRKLR
jgi:membrane-associated phospholipid phosphatase